MARPKAAGTTYQRADGKWVAQIYTSEPGTGQRRKVRRYASNEASAKRLLASLRRGEVQPRVRGSESMTVVEWLEVWAEKSLPVSGLKPTTQSMYLTMIRNPLTPSLGRVRLDLFTPSEADAWLQRLAKVPSRVQNSADREAGRPARLLSAGTRRNAFNALKRALETAVRDGLIESNPLDHVARPVARRAEVPVTPAAAVDDVILPAVANLRVGPLVTLVALTGCRVGEAAGLTWRDCDLDAKVPTVTFRRSSPTSESTKTDRVRTVPLLPEALTALRTQRTRQLEDRLLMGEGWRNSAGLVFTTGTGLPMDMHNARRDLARVLAAHDLPTARPFHSLRHGLASRLLARNLPLPVVSAILGHSSVRLTADLYGHIEGAAHAEAFALAMGR